MKKGHLFLVALLAVSLFAPAAQATDDDHSIEISHNSYAAIAYSPGTGKYAYASDHRSRKAAEKAALGKCGADDATIACWVNHGFCALALGSDKSCWGAGWEYGNGANNLRAKEKAMKDCQERTTGVYVAVMLSSDGQYIWDCKDHVTIIDKNGNVYRGNGELITPSPQPTPAASNEDPVLKELRGKTSDGGNKK
jgi:uncharacterized low-complexity protein